MLDDEDIAPANNPKAQLQPDDSLPNKLATSDGPSQSGDEAEDITSFWWKDLDYDQTIRCGRFKCYFFSASNPDHGYLVMKRRSSWGKLAPAAYYLAKRLESEHNITHLYTNAPFTTKTPESFVEHADGTDWGSRYAGAELLVVQPSRNAPEKAIVYKCNGHRKTQMLDYLKENGHEGYEERLLEGLAKTIILVDSTPGLVYDFQFMVDLDGRFYEIDLDRAVEVGGRRATIDCRGECKGQREIRACMEDAMTYVKKSMH